MAKFDYNKWRLFTAINGDFSKRGDRANGANEATLANEANLVKREGCFLKCPGSVWEVIPKCAANKAVVAVACADVAAEASVA